jgi:hypothetical protein
MLVRCCDDDPVDDIAGLTERWESLWPSSRPIGHELRSSAADRWVRFHSLPGSKRYADTPSEWAELMGRHNTVLADLFNPISADSQPPVALLITASWGAHAEREREPVLISADPTASLWRSDEWDPDPEFDERWTHLWTSTRPWSPGCLDAVLTLVANWETADVIIAPPSLEWLYHPYDGGADVIARNSVERDALALRYQSWLSDHPHGL